MHGHAGAALRQIKQGTRRCGRYIRLQTVAVPPSSRDGAAL